MERGRVRAQAVHLAFVTVVLLLVVTFKSSSVQTFSRPEGYDFQLSASDAGQVNPLVNLLSTLETLGNRTVLPYDEALRYNEQTCAGRGIQSNPDQVKGEVAFWRSLTEEQMIIKRQEVIQRIKDWFGLPGLLRSENAQTVYSSQWGEGRGIVFTGGNADTLQRLHTSLRILRNRHGCKLPVEIFSFPEEMQDKPGEGLRGQIEALGGVTFRELYSSAKLHLWKNFQIKGESIVKSSFAEVLYLDSDNILLTDPTFLFDHPLYKQHGVVFWPDITKDGPANPIWRMTGLQCRRNDWQLDSGQIIIDKRGQSGLNLAALVAASAMQTDHEFWFKISGGDKDTFRYGFYMLDLPYSVSPHWLSSYGVTHNYQKDGHTFCGLAMFQYALSPNDWAHYPQAKAAYDFKSTHAPPLFVHANLLKHSSGYTKGRTFTTVKRMKHDLVKEHMDTARSVVYHSWQGMCVDIWDSFDEVNPRENGHFDNGDVILEESSEALGGVLRDFDDMFYAEGGKAGGF